MEKLKEYRFKLKHDKGSVIIKTIANDLHTAVKKVCDAELCPQRAIQAISCRPVKQIK